MPSRTIPILSYTAGALVAAYLTLVIVTVSFAAMRTDLALAMRDTQNDIAELEHDYYAAINQIGRTDPASMGLVKPADVHYATEVSGPALSRR